MTRAGKARQAPCLSRHVNRFGAALVFSGQARRLPCFWCAKLSVRSIRWLLVADDHHLIAAQPANSFGLVDDLQPIILLIENRDFRAIPQGVETLRFVERSAADDSFGDNHDCGCGVSIIIPDNGEADSEQRAAQTHSGSVTAQRRPEFRFPLAKRQQDKPKPERCDGQQRPFVEVQFLQTRAPIPRVHAARHILADELKVGLDVGIAWREGLGTAIPN